MVLTLYKNKIIIPCKKNTKIAIISGWSNLDKEFSFEYTNQNKAWVLEEKDFIIDIDIKAEKNAIENAKKFCEFLDIDYAPNVKTPSGGYHIYLKKEKNIKIKKYNKRYPGVEFKTKGTYVLIPDSKIYEKKYEFIHSKVISLNKAQNKKIDKLFNKLNKNEIIKNYSYQNNIFQESTRLRQSSREELLDILEYLNADCEYSEWIQVGFGLHDWSNGGMEGYHLWENWSKSGTKYKDNSPGQMFSIYHSFSSAKGKLVTVGTLKYLATQRGYKPNKKYTAPYNNRRVVPLKGLNKNPLEELKKIEQYKKEWYKNWAYKPFPKSVYINLKTMQYYDSVSFNRENYKYIPSLKNEKGKEIRYQPTQYLDKMSEFVRLPVVEYEEYNPRVRKIIFKDKNGKKVHNLCREKYFPKPALKYSKEGLESVEFFKKVCSILTNGDGPVLLDYIAHIFQKRGKRIGWFILLGSKVQGVGKTFLLTMIRKMIGEHNSKITSAESLANDNFNPWADARCFLGVNEFYVPSSNRKILQNRLKSVITDKEVVINQKFQNEKTIRMFANGIFCTNHKDCVSDLKNDRRLFYSFLDLETDRQFQNYIGMSIPYYNSRISNCLKNYREVLKYLLEEHEISKDFNKDMRPPLTLSKQIKIQQEDNNIKGYLEAIDLIKFEPNEFWNKDYIIIGEIIKKLSDEDGDTKIFFSNQDTYKLKKALAYDGSVYRPKLKMKSFETYRPTLLFKKSFPKELEVERKRIVNSYIKKYGHFIESYYNSNNKE